MRKYRHLFFDLDNTLWDFEASSAAAFSLLFEHFGLKGRGLSLSDFSHKYHQVNDALWALYREGRIEKEVLRSLRFRQTLEAFGIDEAGLDEKMSEFYLHHAPRIVKLEPGATEILEYLAGKYELHLITNGFAEVQYTKLNEGRLGHFFKHIITSEEAGVKKPDPAIFRLALLRSGAQAHESLMVGDDAEVDIEGARNCGMDQVFYNPKKTKTSIVPTYEIERLTDLKEILG